MGNGTGGGASEGSAHTQQPGVTSADLGEEVDHVEAEDIEIASQDEVAPPATAPDDSSPSVNADLVDDPEEMVRTIEEASGQSVEIVESADAPEESSG